MDFHPHICPSELAHRFALPVRYWVYQACKNICGCVLSADQSMSVTAATDAAVLESTGGLSSLAFTKTMLGIVYRHRYV